MRPLSALFLALALSVRAAEEPNVVVIFCDDLAYGDVGCFGAKEIATPNIDRLAAEGLRLTSFYVSQAVCSASRTSLLTGCLPNRLGIFGALSPNSKTGINPDETTLPEVFKAAGYATGMAGKWHLGDQPVFNPIRHGFDQYFGLPYSNDMWPVWYDGTPAPEKNRKGNYPPLYLLEGDQKSDAVANLEDQSRLTGRYTERAVNFIRANADKPFFFYLAHSMPHVPLAASPAFRGKSKAGLFGDVIQEIDASVGAVLQALVEAGVAQNTLVIFTSDNGPWLRFGNHAGSARPLREGKGTMFDGGCRVPFVARWPGKIQAGRVSDAIVSTLDVLPTCAALLGAPLPAHKIDGVDQSKFLLDPATPSARDSFVYYYGDQLQAIREGKWKYHLNHNVAQYMQGSEPGKDGMIGSAKSIEFGPALFDLDADIGETHDLKGENPEVVARLTARVKAFDEELRANRRPVGKVP